MAFSPRDCTGSPRHVPAPPAELEAHRMTHLAGAAVRRLRTLRRRRDDGALTEDEYGRTIAAELEDGQPPSPGCAA